MVVHIKFSLYKFTKYMGKKQKRVIKKEKILFKGK